MCALYVENWECDDDQAATQQFSVAAVEQASAVARDVLNNAAISDQTNFPGVVWARIAVIERADHEQRQLRIAVVEAQLTLDSQKLDVGLINCYRYRASGKKGKAVDQLILDLGTERVLNAD